MVRGKQPQGLAEGLLYSKAYWIVLIVFGIETWRGLRWKQDKLIFLKVGHVFSFTQLGIYGFKAEEINTVRQKL